jgi:hypothetical protein
MEKRLDRAILKALRARGAWAFKTMPLAGYAGLPDIIGCYRGRLFAFEDKSPGKRATPLQRHVLAQIAVAGGITAVCYSVDDALRALPDSHTA